MSAREAGDAVSKWAFDANGRSNSRGFDLEVQLLASILPPAARLALGGLFELSTDLGQLAVELGDPLLGIEPAPVVALACLGGQGSVHHQVQEHPGPGLLGPFQGIRVFAQLDEYPGLAQQGFAPEKRVPRGLRPTTGLAVGAQGALVAAREQEDFGNVRRGP